MKRDAVNKKKQWVEHTYSGALSSSHNRKRFVSNTQLSGNVKMISILFGIFAVAVVTRLIYIQGFMGAKHLQAAEHNRVRIIPIPSNRGIIYDRNNQPLVGNTTSFSLTILPQDLPKKPETRDEVIQKAAGLAGIPTENIIDILEEYRNYSYEALHVATGIDYQKALNLIIESADLPGIRVENTTQRLYSPLDPAVSSTPSSLSHILGYVGKLSPEELKDKYDLGYLPTDTLGKTGIEKNYEDFLRGHYGKQRVEVDAAGRKKLTLAQDPPTPGRHVVLGIDKSWQQNLERITKDVLKAKGVTRAAAIILNPNSGVINAMVSIPTYNNNDFTGGIDTATYRQYADDPDNPLFNRAVAGTYPSGSTIKPLLAAAALQENIISQNSRFKSEGGLQVSRWFFPDWKAGGHGITGVIKAIAESVNTFFYIIGGGYEQIEGLGVDRIKQYLVHFGLTQKLGIDIPAEASGHIPSPEWKQEAKGERWYIGDTYNLSIGQGDVLVTPLQMGTATAALLNGGTVYRPHLAIRVVDPSSAEVQPIDPQIITTLPIEKTHLQTVKQGMQACVEYGSCVSMSTLPVSSGGKTGTAQWSSKKAPHSWFAGFAPYDDPELVIAVVVEEGEGGTKTALPIAREFLRWWSTQ